MARRLRIQVRDVWHAVMNRGNGGEVIYRNAKYRRGFLGRAAELPERFGTEIHAFVLRHSRQDRERDDGSGEAHPGWRLADVVREVRSLKYAAAAQGIVVCGAGRRKARIW